MADDVAYLSQSEASAFSLKTLSILAKDSSLFLAWRSSVKIWVEDDPCERAKTLYNQLREFKPPRWLNDIDVSLEKAFAGQGEFFPQLKEWGGQQLDSSADDADTYNLRILLPALCFSFLKIKNSILQNKKSQRRGLEDIIEFAFGVGKGNFNILYESPIRLRESPEVAVCPNAIVDTLVTFPVTNLKGKPVKPDDLLKTAEFTVVRNAWWSPDPPADISVIVFPSEYKRPDLDTNCNQVIIDFCTTQSQRRTLGAEDDIIFGMAAARGEAVIYSCWWEGDEMFYAKHEAWMLTDPRQFIGFYVFLCNLANHARKSLQTMFTSYQANDRVTALTTHLWRAPDHPPKRSYKRSRLSDGSSDDRQAGGSGDVGRDDLEPAEEREYGHAVNLWQAQKERALDQVPDSNTSLLSGDHVKKLRRSLAQPSDAMEALTVSVDSWRSSVVA